MIYCGWRKPITSYEQIEKNVEKGQSLDIPKHKALVSLKKIAHPLGLKAQQILLLDIFAALSAAQDWEGGQRPIVWPCNEYLMQQTGFSLSALRRHIRKLCELGIVFMKDSPNGKRYGRRNAKGYIIEAYGFDLSPIAARSTEFEALFTHLQEQRAKEKQINTQITLTRRQAKAIINIALEEHKTKLEKGQSENKELSKQQEKIQIAYSEDKNCNDHFMTNSLFHLNTELDSLISCRPSPSSSFETLAQYLKQLSNLLTNIKNILKEKVSKASDIDKIKKSQNNDILHQNQTGQIYKKMAPKHVKTDTHIHTTNKNKYVNSNKNAYNSHKQTYTNLNQKNEITQVYKNQIKVENKSISTFSNAIKNSTKRTFLAPQTFLNACPHFKDMAEGLGHECPNDWTEIHTIASKISLIAGIPVELWHITNHKLGKYQAILSIALIYEKLNNGQLKSPQAYLNAMIKRSDSGNLHLMRSFYGQLSKSTYCQR